MKRKQRFTVEQHWLVGNLLFHTYSTLQSQLVSVSSSYHLQSRQVRHLERALKALGGARSALDDAAAPFEEREKGSAEYAASGDSKGKEGHQPSLSTADQNLNDGVLGFP